MVRQEEGLDPAPCAPRTAPSAPGRAWMKRSFDGIHVGYLAAIKKNAPADYQKILDWFPFVEAEVWRHERAGLR
jgi:hypothetical protein